MVNEPLFDNRYRYDHIYPRGRSGETLRAIDTKDQDRPVVIKRPAPQDAPPLRAAQAVSIQTEKKALERLSGHPCLTEIRGSGQMRAGGTSYLYIVMDRATGQTLEEMVLSGQRLPELEWLTILDQLLDLLMTAHIRHVIYNDVDAKHLFWNRETYHLKVIDWGNAVMIDEGGQSGITIANDIYQVGELIYFVYHGGARLNSETTSDGDYIVHFNPQTPPEIQKIITQATHPNIKLKRFGTMRQLREAVDAYRIPIEKGRDQLLSTVQSQLSPQASKTVLEDLAGELQSATQLDPAYPPLRQVQESIQIRLQHLAAQADFDAARIYLETGNWRRAIHLIEEIIPKADPQMARELHFLAAAAEQFEQGGKNSLPEDFPAIIDLILADKPQGAAQILMNIAEYDRYFGDEAWLIAERLAVIMPTVILLRPHLIRLIRDTHPVNPQLAAQIEGALEKLNAPIELGLSPLINRYGNLAIDLADLTDDLEKLPDAISADRLMNMAGRAQSAAQKIVSYLKQVGQNAYSSPETAHQAIETARLIDTSSPHFESIGNYLEQVYQAIHQLSGFTPTADGSHLLHWLETSQQQLSPYTDITDPNFVGVHEALEGVKLAWVSVQDMLVLGRRQPVLRNLDRMAQTIRPFNGKVADWLTEYRRLIEEAREPERFAAHQALVNFLLEGYSAWDSGQMGGAGDYARRAAEIATTPAETQAAQRLRSLAELTADWLTQNGLHDSVLTNQIERDSFALFLKDEASEYERFTHQMKSEDTYLKAMKLGLVTFMHNSSAVGWRVLFLHYILRGVMEIQSGDLEAADFWRQAALNTYPNGKIHHLFTTFDGEITRLHLIARAEAVINQVKSFDGLPELKKVLNAPLADQWFKDAQKAVSLLENILNLWANGDFRAVRDHLNESLDLLDSAQDNGLNVMGLKTWILPYRDRAVELMERRQVVEQAAMVGSPKPDPDVLRALEQIVDISEASVGIDHSRTFRIWRDLYKTMLRTHTNQRLEKHEKMREFEGNFSALFIEKHPAYRLFERWYEAARALPDDEEEELQIQIEDHDSTTEAPFFEDDPPPPPKPEPEESEEEEIKPRRPSQNPQSSGGGGWNLIIIGALVILLAFGGFASYQFFLAPSDEDELSQTESTSTPTEIALQETETVEEVIILPTNTPTKVPPTASHTPTDVPTLELPTNTLAPSRTPTNTPLIPTIAPTLTPSQVITIVTNTPPPFTTNTPIPIIPTATRVDLAPDIGSSVDVLDILDLIQPADYAWDALFFSQGAGGVWQLGASIEEAGTAPIAVIMPPDFMEAFNPDTGLRLRRVEAKMELTLFDEERIEGNQVFFGIGLQNERRQRYSTQVQLRQVGVVSFGINENGTFRGISQLPLQNVEVTLSIQRDADGTLDFFVNGQQLGKSPNLFPIDEPVSLVLYNAGGGMFVSVSSLTLQLTPYEGN